VALCFALGIVFARLDHPTLVAASRLLVGAGTYLKAGLAALRANCRRASALLAAGGFMLAAAAAAPLFDFALLPTTSATLRSGVSMPTALFSLKEW